MSESNSSTNWQKIAVIISALTVILPTIISFSWNVIFPKNYLLYEISSTTKIDELKIATIIVHNAGSDPQKDVVLLLPKVDNSQQIFIEILPPLKTVHRSTIDANPKIPLSQYVNDSSARIPLGNILPDNEVRVTLITRPSQHEFISLFLWPAYVESSTTVGIESDGIRYPRLSGDLHSFYREISFYGFGFILLFFIILFTTSAIYETFFNTPQKKMAALWRQMDLLQERIDKERRYQ